MTRIFGIGFVAAIALLAIYGILTLYDESLQVGRMWETPAVRPYEEPILFMAAGGVPFTGGEALDRAADPDTLQPPFSLHNPEAVSAGRQGYARYCMQCHGRYHDGMGTVGQSFAPLPGDLQSVRVQSMPVGKLFHEISWGFPGGRQPALATTIAAEERWQIIGYIRSLGVRTSP